MSELRSEIMKALIGFPPETVTEAEQIVDRVIALIQKEQGWRDDLSDIIGELADRAAESDFGHFESARKLERRAYELLPTPTQGEDET